MIKPQSFTPIPIDLIKKRKNSINNKHQLNRKNIKNIKIALDFNSQLLSNQNNNDFNSIVNSIQDSLKSTHPHIIKFQKIEAHQQKYKFQSPLKILKCRPGNKYRRIRYSTELSHNSPKQNQRQKRILPSQLEQFKKYSSQSKQIKMRINYFFPNIKQRRSQKFSETVNYMQIIKPWQTKRDVFHETFKRYIADNSRYTKWIKHEHVKTTSS